MPFDHEKLDVYAVALDFLVLANGVVERLPRGRSHIGDQLSRASLSIVLNIAEGAGKYSPGDKRRYYLSASGSALSARRSSMCAGASTLSRTQRIGPVRSSSIASWRCS